MIERHLQRVNPEAARHVRCASRCSRPSTTTPATTWRASGLPTMTQEAVARPFTIEGWQHVLDGLDGGQRRDPGAAAPRRMGVGRSLDDRPGFQDDGRGRGARSAGAVRVVRRAAQRPRNDRRADRARRRAPRCSRRCEPTRPCACCATATSNAPVSRSSSSVSAPRCPPGPATLSLRTGAALLPVGCYFTSEVQRPPRRRASPDPDRCARWRPARRHRPSDPGTGPRARVPDPPRPRAVAPLPTELAQRPRVRRLTRTF